MPCFQLCRAHADRTLACWNGSAFFSCLLCLGSCLHTRSLLDSLGPDLLLASLGVHFHCPSQRRKQCVVIRHFCSSRSLVTCPLKCHASGMSEVRLGNAAVTNDARFQCSQRTLFLSQAIRTLWTSYMGSADCRYSETQADGITSIVYTQCFGADVLYVTSETTLE